MSFGAWLFIIFIGIIVLIITIYLLVKFTNNSNTTTNNEYNQIIEQFIEEVNTVKYWVPSGGHNDPLQPGPDPNRNVCALYTFPGREIKSLDGSIYDPGRPSLNPDVLIDVVPNPNFTQSCVDPDQIIAQEFIQTCSNPYSDEGCYTHDGTIYQNGENHIYYNICPGYPPCKSQLAAVVTRFDPLDPDHKADKVCYQVQGPGEIVTAADCDISNYLQLFQISRVNPGLTANDNGPYAKIFHRDTGLCLVPDPNDNIAEGTAITLDNCTTNSGYIWWTLPSMVLEPTACGDSNGFRCNPPQQLIYTSSINTPIPSNIKDLNKFIASNSSNMFSIIFNTDSKKLELGKYNLGLPHDNNRWKFSTQIIDYQIYDTLYNAPTINSDEIVGYPFYSFGF